VRYDETASGTITHAIRFTAPDTRRAYVWPARHYASDLTDPVYPPMGQRFRLKAAYDISPFPPEVQVILQALKTYGMILADNGSPWFLSGAPDERWDNDSLGTLRDVPGYAFEAVDCSSLMADPNSGRASAAGAMRADIRINGSDGPITLGPREALSISVSLASPRGAAEADWWLLAHTPRDAWFAFQYPLRWRGTVSPAAANPSYQGPLSGIDSLAVFSADASSLPAGDYTLYFGVDVQRNGRLDFGSLTYDQAVCTVER
jgi:hypothetical protein